MPSEREKTAHHEAGHALVAWWFGRPIKSVSIAADNYTWGRNEFGGNLRERNYLVTLCAGMVAECHYQGLPPLIKYLGGTKDLQNLEESAKNPKLSEAEWENCLKIWIAEADGIIRFEDLWLGLRKIAKALLERETISGDDILRIMGPSPNH